jgi:lysophospholipase L1-like esterase
MFLASTPATAANPTPVRVVLVGDSTVTDKAGWGAALAKAFGPGAEVVNLARSGASSKSYRTIGQWKKVLDARPTWVLIQFGHNDQPGKGPDRETDPKTTFPENLGRFGDEARAAGATPVLVTPLARRVFGPDGKVRADQRPYAEAARAVAAEKKVPLVDLYARSVEELERLGPDKVKGYGPPHPTKPGEVDGTHLSADGAIATAKLVAAGLKTAAPDLAKLLK